MKTRMLLALLVAAFTTPVLASSAAHAALSPALAQAVADFDRAQTKSDAAALKRLLADDYVLFNSSGKVENKADFIRDYTAAGFSLQPFTIEHELVRAWSDGAVMGGDVTLQGTSGGKPYKVRLRFADIWARRNGVWQVVFTQAMRLSP